MKTNYRELYGAIWQFHKKFINEVNASDNFWDSVHKEAVQIGEQFNNHPLIKALLIAEYDEFARILEESKEDDKPP